jgi:hypothetical protein
MVSSVKRTTVVDCFIKKRKVSRTTVVNCFIGVMKECNVLNITVVYYFERRLTST